MTVSLGLFDDSLVPGTILASILHNETWYTCALQNTVPFCEKEAKRNELILV